VCFIVHKTTSELECVILTTLYFAGVENTDSECLTYGSFSLSKTVHFGSLEFIVDCFDGLSLSPWRNDS
jgi:hypothetical protein